MSNVPAPGSQVFTYRTPLQILAAAQPLVTCAIAVYLTFQFANRSSNNTFPLIVSIILLPIVLYSFYKLLVIANEKIEITGETIVWTDWLGRRKATVPISTLGHGSITSKQIADDNNSGSSSGTELFILNSPAGTIRFTSRIKNSKELCDRLFEICDGVAQPNAATEPTEVPDLTCRYVSKGIAVFLAVFGGLFVIMPIVAYISSGGHVMVSVNNGPEREGSPLLLLPFVAAGVAIMYGALWSWQRIEHESIVISDGRITWTDSKAKVRVDCPTSDLVAGSFKEILGGQGGGRYEVATKTGVVKWDRTITNNAELCRIMENATRPPSNS